MSTKVQDIFSKERQSDISMNIPIVRKSDVPHMIKCLILIKDFSTFFCEYLVKCVLYYTIRTFFMARTVPLALAILSEIV